MAEAKKYSGIQSYWNHENSEVAHRATCFSLV